MSGVFRRYRVAASQGRRVKYLDHARVPDRDVEATEASVEEHHVRDAGDGVCVEHFAGVRIDRDEHASITRTKQPTASHVDVEAMRPCMWDGGHSTEANRITGFDNNDLRRVGDVDMKRIADRIVDGPARATGNADIGDTLPGADIHDGHGERARRRGVADMRNEQSRAPGIVGESVRPYSNGDLFHARSLSGGEHANGILATVRREHEVVRNQRSGDRGKVRNGSDVSLNRDVDHIDGIVRGVGDVNPTGRLVYG